MNRWFFGMFGIAMVCACSSSSTTGDGGAILIGAVLSQTGSGAAYGTPALQAVELALDEINDAGGVLGRPLQLAQQDDKTVPDASITACQALAAQGVTAIIGGSESSEALPMAELVTDPDQIVLVSPSATSPLYTALHASGGGFTFRTVPSDVLQSAVLTEIALDAGYKRISVLYEQGQAYTVGLATGFSADFADAGGTIWSSLGYTGGQLSYSAELQQLFDAGVPDATAMFAYQPEGMIILSDFYVSGYATSNMFWYSSDGLPSPNSSFLAGLTGLTATTIEGHIQGTEEGLPNTTLFQTFSRNFNARFSQTTTPLFAANAYDATYMIALAMQAEGKTTGAAISTGLMAIGTTGTTVINPGQFAQAITDLKGGQTIKYVGASGNCTFNAAGEVNNPYDVWSITGSPPAVNVVEQNVSAGQ